MQTVARPRLALSKGVLCFQRTRAEAWPPSTRLPNLSRQPAEGLAFPFAVLPPKENSKLHGCYPAQHFRSKFVAQWIYIPRSVLHMSAKDLAVAVAAQLQLKYEVGSQFSGPRLLQP